ELYRAAIEWFARALVKIAGRWKPVASRQHIVEIVVVRFLIEVRTGRAGFRYRRGKIVEAHEGRPKLEYMRPARQAGYCRRMRISTRRFSGSNASGTRGAASPNPMALRRDTSTPC